MKPHLSEANFRRFEGELEAFICGYPQTHRIECYRYGLAPTTIAARIRDAKLSLKQFNWTTTIPKDEFLQYYKSIEIVAEDTTVAICDRDTYRKEPTLKIVPRSRVVDLDKCKRPMHVIQALAVLHEEGVLSDPTIFTSQNSSLLNEVQELEDSYDIAVTKKGNSYEII
jgi:hypothetical protein